MGIELRQNERLPAAAVVLRDARLQLLGTCERDAVEPDHLVESTNPCSSRSKFSIDMPRYVPFQVDLRTEPYGRGASDIVMCI